VPHAPPGARRARAPCTCHARRLAVPPFRRCTRRACARRTSPRHLRAPRAVHAALCARRAPLHAAACAVSSHRRSFGSTKTSLKRDFRSSAS
jgi:hypothetical protein